MEMKYAGIGSRETPKESLEAITMIASWMRGLGWHLHTGGAQGADQAFYDAHTSLDRSVFLPWPGFNNLTGDDTFLLNAEQLEKCMEIARKAHPRWPACTYGAKKLHSRNAAIILGLNADDPVNAVVCWTPGGHIRGGTALGINLAKSYGIPVFNLGIMNPKKVCEGILKLNERQ